MRFHITHRKFSRAPWSQKVSQKPDESQKFRESQLALKSQIFYFPLIPKRSFISTHRMTMFLCALKTPDLGQAFTQLVRFHITHRKVSRATWSRNISQKVMNVRNFESLSWLWRFKYCIFQLFRSVASLLRTVWPWFDVRWRTLCSKAQKEWLRAPSPHIR